MRCLPFSEAVYRGLQEQGLDAGQLLNNPRLYQRKGSWYRNSDSLENDLLAEAPVNRTIWIPLSRFSI